MKKYLVLSLLAACSLAANAQDFDTKPTIKIDNKAENMHFTIGARFMADAGYFHSDFTPLKSGADITDARIRTSLKYNQWYFYADFGFGGGKFSQKNIFLQWATKDGADGNHAIKAGYYNDPASMSRNTSSGSYHFITRASAAMALQEGRQLGVTYKYFNPHFFANQGVFAERKYNNQLAGSQGITLSGRWLYLPINNDDQTLHIGVNARFATINTGKMFNANVKQTSLTMGTPFETYIDEDQLVQATLPWAKNVTNIGAEALYRNNDFFARGEFTYRHVTKDRDDESLFESNLGSIDSWGSLKSWQAGNPLGSNNFKGGYVEMGYKIFGDAYKYNSSEGTLGGLNGKSLEVVARYSYTGLNDIKKGELYEVGRDQYYPNNKVADWPATGLSIGGGDLHSITLGVNYAFNKYAQVMVDYGFHHMNRDKYPMDKNFHSIQTRLQFAF